MAPNRPTPRTLAPKWTAGDYDSTIEARVEELAGGQHGLVTRAQLLGIGLGKGAVKYRVNSSRLWPVQRGVYRVGPLVSPRMREMAAVLACGPKAVISHRSVAVVWQQLPPPRELAPMDVTVRSQDRRRRPGVRLHRCEGLEPDEVTTIEGIPVTTPARTLLDLASTVSSRELEQALARAERSGLVKREKLLSLVARHPRHRGARVLLSLLREGAAPAFTRSEAEERFLALMRKSRLPVPETNVTLEGYEVDFLWRRERLVVEVDGFAFHSSPGQFERDRTRDAQLSAEGLQVVRVTWRQLVNEPEAMLVRLALTLARHSAVGGLA